MVEFSYNSARVVRSTNLAAAAYKLTEINSAMRARGGFIYMDYNIYMCMCVRGFDELVFVYVYVCMYINMYR